jgi:type II secretory pathway pseudopilin PulG
MREHFHNRKQERGQTLLLVVVAMAVLVGMAALAIDIATLYTAHNETRRAAEAAALAGAQAIASSGITSGFPVAQSTVCNQNVTPGGAALAEQRALAVVAQNPVAGGAATLQATVCDFTLTTNPRFTAVVQRTGLPTFFGRIWGSFPGSATATATAEAYNASGPSGGGSRPPIQVGSVKPWAIPNCDPSHLTPAGTNCGGAASFVSTSNGAISNPVVGTVFDLSETTNLVVAGGWTQSATPPGINFLAVDVPISASSVSCPSSSRVSCSGNGLSLDPTNPQFDETIACSNSQQLSCGQQLNVHAGSGSSFPPITGQQAALCLIHASNTGNNRGQDLLCNNQLNPSCPSTSPINVDAGSNNPDPGLLTKDNLNRSDSIVTVPLFTPSCSTGCTNGPVTIVGFLQLGIGRVRASTGVLRTIVMNVIGCQGTSGTPISGGGVSPIPVRLVQ